MKYALLVYSGEDVPVSPSKRQLRYGEFWSVQNRFGAEPRSVTGTVLKPATRAARVRVREGRTHVTFSPAESSDNAVSAFYMVERDDTNELLDIATRLSMAMYGSVEVRPLEPSW